MPSYVMCNSVKNSRMVWRVWLNSKRFDYFVNGRNYFCNGISYSQINGVNISDKIVLATLFLRVPLTWSNYHIIVQPMCSMQLYIRTSLIYHALLICLDRLSHTFHDTIMFRMPIWGKLIFGNSWYHTIVPYIVYFCTCTSILLY